MFAGEKKTTQLKLKCSIFTLYCNSFILFFLAFLTRTLFHVLTTVKRKSKKQGVNPLVKKQKEEQEVLEGGWRDAWTRRGFPWACPRTRKI